jgi:predicted outer membrane repeat protein
MKTTGNSRGLKAIPLVLAIVVLCQSASGKVIYVHGDAKGTNNGTSWQNAYVYLQDALADANDSEKPVEIRVAQGIYKPDQGAKQKPGRREATFELINGVSLAGGYAGLAKADSDTRDVDRYKTILSGDLAGNDINIKDAHALLIEPSRSENSYHVLTSSGVGKTCVLDGFVITAGNASEDYSSHEQGSEGGGMYASGSRVKLVNCRFTGNSASNRGGGIYATDSDLVLVGCSFSENSASDGGGIADDRSSNPTLSRCSFIGNIALAPLANAGGMLNQDSSHATLTNCIFSGNSAAFGDGMNNEGNAGAMLTCCTFTQNSAKDSGSIAGTRGKVVVIGSIFWGNTPVDTERTYQNAVMSYSDIEGGWPGVGNINTDPFFADPGKWVNRNDPNIVVEPRDPNAVFVDGDYHLRSQEGRWNRRSESWVKDDVTSPCIDVGDPNGSPGDEPSPNGGRINVGAYGGVGEASKSPKANIRVSAPKRAFNPKPCNGQYSYSPGVKLHWTPGLNAISHDVYFGPNNPPPFIRNQTTGEFDPGGLKIYDTRWYLRARKTDETYYWRIDEIDQQGKKWPGDLWRFTVIIAKGRACFLANTPVWIDGKQIPISMARRGQIVDNAGKIEDVQAHEGTFACYDISLQSGNCLTVAENHYFMAESGQWLSLHNLKAGMKLKTAKGSVRIAAVARRPKAFVGNVYNLKVEGSGWYVVGEDGLIVRDY